jgi:hypothetical protein
MDSVTGTDRRPALADVYGVRLLYRSATRRQLALMVLVLCAAYHALQVVVEFLSLDRKVLDADFHQYWRGALDLNAGRNPYQVYLDMHCTTMCLTGYIYTPIVAEVLRPLALLPERVAAGLWLGLGEVAVLAAALVLYLGLRRDLGTTPMLALLAAGLVYSPIFESHQRFQVAPLLLLPLAGAAVLYLRGGRRQTGVAGGLVGMAGAIKVQPFAVAPGVLPPGWARARGEELRVALREAAAGLSGLLVASAGLIGGMLVLVPYTDQFFTQILPQLSVSTIAWQNRSLPGYAAHSFIVLRETLTGAAPTTELNIPYSTTLGAACLVIFVGAPVVLAALAAPGRTHDRRVRAAYFAALVAAMPIASVLTWRHHLTVTFLAIVLVSVSLWPRKGAGLSRRARWLLVIAYPLLLLNDDALYALAGGGAAANASFAATARVLLVEGANLWGMLALWLAAMLALVAAMKPKTSLAAEAA